MDDSSPLDEKAGIGRMVGSMVPDPVLAKDRLLVVGAAGRLEGLLRERYPELKVDSCDTMMSAICEVADRSPRAVVTFVEPSFQRLGDAVAGLREAGGDQMRLVLCCEPEGEPLARQAVECGADDYIVYPVASAELDVALGYVRVADSGGGALSAVPAAGLEELKGLADLLNHLEDDPGEFVRRLAELIQGALGAEGVNLVVSGSVTSVGQPLEGPVLAEAIRAGGQVLGQVGVGPKLGGPYGSGDVDKLRHYANLAGHLLDAAKRQRDWRSLALTDELSGLPNRRYLLRFLDQIMETAGRERFRVTLLLFDIDDFKTYNDACGHDAGDEIIRLAGKLFERHSREHDLVTRYGGDEFAVVFWDAEQPRVADSSHPGDAMDVLARFTRDLGAAEPAGIKSKLPGAQLTISGGLATYPWDAGSRDELIRKADEALLEAKRAGKNRVFTVGE